MQEAYKHPAACVYSPKHQWLLPQYQQWSNGQFSCKTTISTLEALLRQIGYAVKYCTHTHTHAHTHTHTHTHKHTEQ